MTAARAAGWTRAQSIANVAYIVGVCTGLALLHALAHIELNAIDLAWDLLARFGTADLPAGTIKVSPPVPGMGEHWANPRNLPLGPIYCVTNGKVIKP